MGKAVARRKVPKGTERKAHVQQRGERGQGLKFKLETFAAISSFRPGTRIKYGPNPKREGSKSHSRYAGYMRAKTVGEALAFGAKKADFFWELERGDYEVLGTERSEEQEVAAIGKRAYNKAVQALQSFVGPRGLPVKSFSDPKAAEELKKEEAWREQKLKKCEAMAKELGLRVETAAEIEAVGECADIRLQRRVANEVSDRMLKAAKKGNKGITDADMSKVLHMWGFSENSGRLNVLPNGRKYVYSDTIGAIRRRTGVFDRTPPTRKYPAFSQLLCQWLADNRGKLGLKNKFVFSAINLNANYAGRRHRDANNEGPSVIRAFGKFTGGKLVYWPKDNKKVSKFNLDTLNDKDSVKHDLSKKTVVFDGNKAHEVQPFAGERYSVVFFTSGGWKKASGDCVKKLKQVGFAFPTASEMSTLKKEATKL